MSVGRISDIPASDPVLFPHLPLQRMYGLRPRYSLTEPRILNQSHTSHRNILYVPGTTAEILGTVHKTQIAPEDGNMLVFMLDLPTVF